MLRIGSTLNGGRYQVIEQLSSGGFGNTYKVEEVFKKKVYAMKEFFIRTINERDADGKTVKVSNKENLDTFIHQKEKFLVEAERLRDIDNPNIVKVHDFFSDNETSYYVMDFIEGCSLDQRDEPLHEKEAWHVLDQILNALSCIHQVKTFEDGKERIWVHLDISPSNLMIDDQRHITLIDFGSSKQLSVGDAPSISHISQLAFKKGYSPLEQTSQRFDSIGPWTDFYALGATLYNLQTSVDTQIPEYSELQDKINDGVDLAQAFHFPQDMSEKMRKLIVWMMNPNRKGRPQSVSDIRSYIKPDPDIKPDKNDEFTGFKHILTIETYPVNGGIVSVNPEKKQYDDGESVVCVAKPQNGYQFHGWFNSNGEQVGNEAIYSFKIANNTKFTARFKTGEKHQNLEDKIQDTLSIIVLWIIFLVGIIFFWRALSNWDDDNQFKDSQIELSDTINDDNQNEDLQTKPSRDDALKSFCGEFYFVAPGIAKESITFNYALKLDPINSSCEWKVDGSVYIRDSKGYCGTDIRNTEAWEIYSFSLHNSYKYAIADMKCVYDDFDNDNKFCKIKLELDEFDNIKMSYIEGNGAPGVLIDNNGGYSNVVTFIREEFIMDEAAPYAE